jgi:hypothetical protein
MILSIALFAQVSPGARRKNAKSGIPVKKTATFTSQPGCDKKRMDKLKDKKLY